MTTPYTPSLRERLVEAQRFATLLALVDEVGLADALDGHIMLLAPPDPVFDAMPASSLVALRADRNLLARHAIRGSFHVANGRGADPMRVRLDQPLLASWWFGTANATATAGPGDEMTVQTVGGPVVIRVGAGVVTAGGATLRLDTYRRGRYYEVDRLVGSSDS